MRPLIVGSDLAFSLGTIDSTTLLNGSTEVKVMKSVANETHNHVIKFLRFLNNDVI